MSKAERIDSVHNTVHTEEELIRRLPEIDAIYDGEIRALTIEFFLRAVPDYFWERAASSTGKYHPPDESGAHGTWLHTKRVFYEYSNMSESLVELGEITERQRECGKAAALIHDTFNYGWPSENRDMTDSGHDVIVSEVADNVVEMPDEVIRLINKHMGPWGEGENPETPNEICLHLADKSAAATNHTQGVYYPAEEIQKEWPDVEQIEVENERI